MDAMSIILLSDVQFLVCGVCIIYTIIQCVTITVVVSQCVTIMVAVSQCVTIMVAVSPLWWQCHRVSPLNQTHWIKGAHEHNAVQCVKVMNVYDTS